MDRFVVKFTSATDALPQAWKDSPPPSPKTVKTKRPVGRPPKRKREEETESSSPKRQKSSPEDTDATATPVPVAAAQITTAIAKLPNTAPIRGHYKTYSLKEKRMVVQHAKLHGIRQIAKLLSIPKSTLMNWTKIDFEDGADRLTDNGRERASGRPVTYGTELDDRIAEWILTQRDLQIPISPESVCNYAKELVKKERPGLKFEASRMWLSGFFKRHNFALRSRTSLAQRLPQDLEKKLESFWGFVNERREEDEFEDDLIINMDETPVYFDLVPGKTVNKRGEKSVLIRTTGAEKRHLTLVLAVTAAGTVLPPMVIFKGKRALKDISMPKEWIVTVQEKAWMDETLMLRWVKEIYVRHTKRERSLCVLDSFRGHITEEVKKTFRRSNAVMAVIPGGCTSKVQPLDVSINKPVKGDLRRSWNTFMQESATAVAADQTLEKVKSASKQQIVDWIKSAVVNLATKRELIQRSFKVCGITTSLDGAENEIRCSDQLIKGLLTDDDMDDLEFDFEGFTEEDLIAAENQE